MVFGNIGENSATGVAALNMDMDMPEEGLIDDKTAVTRLTAEQPDEILHPLNKTDSFRGNRSGG